MTSEERDLINGLFDRLKNLTPSAKDAEAAQLIDREIAALPDSPYHLVQTLLVQEHALQNAQLRINQLQQQLTNAAQQSASQPSGGGGFLSGLFHHQQPAAATPPPMPSYPTTAAMPASSGGGFLRGALSTAAGVAGGSLLFQGIEDLLGHRAGAFGSMLGGGYGGGAFGGGGGFMPGENVEVVNNYYGNDNPSNNQPDPGNSFLPPDTNSGNDPSLQSGFDTNLPDPFANSGSDPGAGGNDPGLGVDWGSNIDPGPGPDPGAIDDGSSDSGNMVV